MQAMPRPRPPHLHRQITRHGRTVWYGRIDRGRRIRIRAAFDTPDFWREYHAAVRGELPVLSKGAGRVGSLKWLIERFRESAAWRDLSLATRRQRENVLRQVN